jgi:hypothetical protein
VWIAERLRARQAGAAAVRNAADAAQQPPLEVLRQMQNQGGWSDVLWGTADRTAARRVPDGYQSVVGCKVPPTAIDMRHGAH